MLRKATNLFLVFAFIFSLSAVNAQSYRYLKIEIVECDNFKIEELSWFEDGVDYPNPHFSSTNPADNPKGEQAFGEDGSSWVHYQPYDGVKSTHMWFGYITDPLLSMFLVLDLGVGNSIVPESVEMVKPGFSTVSKFKIWASEDNVDWNLFLDTTLVTSTWETQVFPLSYTPDLVAPSTPGNLFANSIASNSLKLNWEHSTDNIALKEYEVYQDGVSIGVTPNTNFYVPNLVPNTKYAYYVTAKDYSMNESEESNIISLYTDGIDDQAPSTPIDLQNISTGENYSKFSWTASTDNVAVVGYLVYLDGNFVGTTEDTHFTIPGLESETAYEITVSAKDIAGNKSLLSEILGVTTTMSENNKMKIASNFWTVNWGDSDPFISTYNAVSEEDPWKKPLLEEVGIYGGFRFMDWASTNNSSWDHWLERPTIYDLDQTEVAYEWMIDFCNRTNKDIWICIPHQVIDRNGYEGGSNSYVKKLAILLKTGVDMNSVDLDGDDFINLSELTRSELIALGGSPTCKPLKSHLKIYIEYSNETWNWGFGQTSYSHEESKHMDLNPTFSGDPDEDWISWIRFHSWAALRVFEQMEDVLGNNTPRLVKLDAYQAVNVSYALDKRFYIYEDPLSVYNPRGIFPDAFSPAPYFGGADSNEMSDAYPQFIENINTITEAVKGTRAYLDSKESELGRDFKIIAYEGGQHDTEGADIINKQPEMYDVYIAYLDSMSSYLDEFWHYNHVAKFGDGGAWGAKEYIGAPDSISHKYRALKDWIGDESLPELDTIPPTIPMNLVLEQTSKTNVVFSWNASTDNVSVQGYEIYLEGVYIGFTSNTSYQISGLSPSTDYSIAVRAMDTSENRSPQSEILNASTWNTYEVSFAVESQGNKIEDAIIDFNGETVLSDSEGEVIIGNLLPESDLNYTVSKAGYETNTGSVDVVDVDVEEEVELTLIVRAKITELDQIVSIYFNHNKNSFIIESDKKVLDLDIHSVSGNLVLHAEINGFTKEIDVMDISEGVYFIKVSFLDNTSKAFKVFKGR